MFSCMRPLFLLGVLFCLALAIAPRAWSQEPEWTDIELARAESRHQDWLFLKPSGEAPCYLKQSYADPDRMEISVIRQGPILICGPFYERIQGRAEVTYWFDDGGERHTRQESQVSNCITLPRELIPRFQAGYTFHVQVELPDRGETISEQVFSLMGFSAAFQEMRSADCP